MNTLDAAALTIMWQRLISIADEMAAVLLRTAFSSVVRESNDLACALLTKDGDLLVEYGRSVPVFTGTVSNTVKNMVTFFGENNIHDGDVIATNDPLMGNTHLPDITAAAPVFHNGVIVAYVASICHVSDIGGASEGAFAHDIFEEGFRLPAVKMVEAGKRNELVRYILAHNVRVPVQVLGDVDALLSANALGVRRLQQMLDENPGIDINVIAKQIWGTTEKALRKAISAIPDGNYRASMEIDGFEEPKTIAVTINVSGDALTVDYEGTSSQSAYGINSSSPTIGYTRYGLACLLIPEIPNNQGALRPISIKIPKGSLLNPSETAAVSANFPAHVIPSVLSSALLKPLPNRVSAADGTPFWVVSFRGQKDSGETFASILCFNGGQGASFQHDGYSTLSTPSNVSNTPVEVVESQAPILFESKKLARGSGGLGKWNGGEGQEVRLRSVHDKDMEVIFLTERINHGAPGLAGGESGQAGELLLDGKSIDMPKGRIVLHPGQEILLRTPGGGGFGKIS